MEVTAVLTLRPPGDVHIYHARVLHFLRVHLPARSVEVRLSADDHVRFWPILPADLIETAREIAEFVVREGRGMEATFLMRGGERPQEHLLSREYFGAQHRR